MHSRKQRGTKSRRQHEVIRRPSWLPYLSLSLYIALRALFIGAAAVVTFRYNYSLLDADDANMTAAIRSAAAVIAILIATCISGLLLVAWRRSLKTRLPWLRWPQTQEYIIAMSLMLLAVMVTFFAWVSLDDINNF